MLNRVLHSGVVILGVVGCCFMAAIAKADSLTFVSNSPTNFAYDSSTHAVGAPGFAPGFGSSSWAAPGVPTTKIYFSPTTLFSNLTSALTLGDIASISYFTDNGGVSHIVNQTDWYLQIYTTNLLNDNSHFYDHRVTTEPYFAKNLSDGLGFNKFTSAAGPTNELRFFDAIGGYFGSYTDGSLQDIQVPLGNQYIKLFSLGIGSASATGFTGKLDGLTVTLKNGNVGTVNFEGPTVAPLPSTAWMGMSLFGLLGMAYGARRLGGHGFSSFFGSRLHQTSLT